MNKTTIAILLCVSCFALTAWALDDSFPTFMKFVKQYGRQYESVEDMIKRYAIFRENVGRIQKLRDNHKAATGEPGDFVYDITKFADLAPEEFKQQYLGFRPSERVAQAHATVEADDGANTCPAGGLPKTLDWRKAKAISAVKDQAQCGSCWAFSTAEEIESMWFLAHNNTAVPVLSPQQIVSCDTVDAGCNGGDTVSAYAYVQKAGGLETEKAYPYTSGDGDSGTCKFKAASIAAKISGFKYAVPGCTDSCDKQNETALACSLTNQPISICVYAESWQFYSSGILKSDCPHDYSSLDHCVQLVGYDASGSTPYWIVRNSWGDSWGINGYIWIEFGKNLCGVADEATYALI